MMENTDKDEHLQDMDDPSPAKNATHNVHHIIKTLQDKLETLSNEDNRALTPLNGRVHDHQSHENDSRDSVGNGRSLNTDTIVLIGSLIVMILIAKLRSRRRQYHRGLKQFGEQMHVVTRTISNPPSAEATPTGTPSIALRKLAAQNNNNIKMNKKLTTLVAVPDDDNSVFKPSTHAMRKDDITLGGMTTVGELRHQKLHAKQDEE